MTGKTACFSNHPKHCRNQGQQQFFNFLSVFLKILQLMRFIFEIDIFLFLSSVTFKGVLLFKFFMNISFVSIWDDAVSDEVPIVFFFSCFPQKKFLWIWHPWHQLALGQFVHSVWYQQHNYGSHTRWQPHKYDHHRNSECHQSQLQYARLLLKLNINIVVLENEDKWFTIFSKTNIGQ